MPKMKSRIVRISVGRLYNLGSYENCRYDLTVDVAEHESAARCVRAIEKILAGLAPLKPQQLMSPEEANRERERIGKMLKMKPEEFQRQHGDPEGGRGAYVVRCRQSLKENIRRSESMLARAKKARDLFDDLGGAEKWKDAKADWDDEEF